MKVFNRQHFTKLRMINVFQSIFSNPVLTKELEKVFLDNGEKSLTTIWHIYSREKRREKAIKFDQKKSSDLIWPHAQIRQKTGVPNFWCILSDNKLLKTTRHKSYQNVNFWNGSHAIPLQRRIVFTKIIIP